jgi:RHS repeat-associated protein
MAQFGCPDQCIHENGRAWAQTWTVENQLKQATAGSDTVSFTYDADGMMVRRNENGQQTVYLGKLYQHNLNTGIATRHYAFGGKLVALREGNNNVNFLLTDHLGSVTTTLFADGTVRANLRYDPWGKQRWASQTTPTRYRFTAQRFDDKLGLYDYNARYYDANIGRFISADVIVPGTSRLTPLTVGFHETMFLEKANRENLQLAQLGPAFKWSGRQKQELGTTHGSAIPQTLNRYAYALNNPVVRFDPTGHDSVTGTGTYVYQDLTEEEAWAFVNAILGSNGEVGWADRLESIGYEVQVGSAILGMLLVALGVISGGGSSLLGIVLGVGGVIVGEALKQLGATLRNVSNLVKQELENGSQLVRIEITNDRLGFSKVMVRGKDTRALPIGLSNPTAHVLSVWMYNGRYTYGARFHAWWHISHVTFQFGR